MKTEVIMKRKFLDGEISQKSKSEFLSASDLVTIGNRHRVIKGMKTFNLSEFFRLKSTIEFMESLKKEFGEIKVSARGRGTHTWVHPYLFIDIALHIDPSFKIKMYTWLYDELLKYRNTSGDSYKKMTGALYLSIDNKSGFKEKIKQFAKIIKKECGCEDWQKANQEQLLLRDKIQEYFSLLSDIIKNSDNALEVAVEKAKKELYGNA